MTTTILPTRNEAWGFFGTMQSAGADPMQSWNAASAMIAAATDASPEGVRDFLDSRHGRHFADDVAGELGKGLGLEEAIEAAVARWMGWRIDRRTNRDEGHPRRASLPDGLGHPLPDPRRDAGLTPAAFRLPAAHPSGRAARGSRRVGMVPALARKGTTR